MTAKAITTTNISKADWYTPTNCLGWAGGAADPTTIGGGGATEPVTGMTNLMTPAYIYTFRARRVGARKVF